jgi:adenosine deaminase
LLLHVAMFPFKDLKFYGQKPLAIVAEDMQDVKNIVAKASVKRKNREKLLRAFHNNILRNCRPNSLDEVNLMMDKFYPFLWKRVPSQSGSLHSLFLHYFCILEEFTKAMLSHRDGEIVFKYWRNERNGERNKYNDFWDEYSELDKVLFFSAISRLIPMDLLVAVYYSINKIKSPLQLNGFYHHVNLADAPLHDVLQRGVAENHIHASAAFNFTTLWQKVMNGQMDDKYYSEFTVSHYATSDQVQEYITTAKIMRIVMAQFLHENPDVTLGNWLQAKMQEDTCRITLCQAILFRQDGVFLELSRLKEMEEKVKIAFDIDDGDRDHDMIFSILKGHKHIKTFGENLLLHFAMKYKRDYETSNGESFQQFFDVFFKYIAIKNEFYQQITQSSTVKGLDFFKPYFDRATKGGQKSSEQYYKTLMRTLFQNQYLRKVELRLGILDTEQRNNKTLKTILSTYRKILDEDYGVKDNPNVNFPRIGIIYHFFKQTDDIEKCWCAFDEQKGRTYGKLHYGSVQLKYVNQIKMILNLRKKLPYLANFIVGIDAASLENNTPVQVFAPVFGQARNSDEDSILIKDRDGKLAKNQSLFFTFHAGEDFRHINSGLRRIDEVIDHCKLHAGDRIGHGIALGVDIQAWVRRNKVVIIPRGEYLDNLLWIWSVYSKTSNINPRTHIYLEQKIYSVASKIFQSSNGLTVPLLYEVYRRRFKQIKLDGQQQQCVMNSEWICGDTDRRSAAIWDSDRLLFAYHCKSYLERMTEPVYVNSTNIEEEMSIDMQRYLIGKVAMNGIVVEVNPSSNDAIGQMDSLYSNQFFNIQSPDHNQLSNIIININSDDPMVFNTNVSNEIAYLYYGMLDRGIGKEAALLWIEKLRKSGMDTSFIRGNIDNYEYIKALDSLLEAFDDPM